MTSGVLVVVEDVDVDVVEGVGAGEGVVDNDVEETGSVGCSDSSATVEVGECGSSFLTVSDDRSVDAVVGMGAASAVGPGASTSESSDTRSIEFQAVANPNAS